MASAMDRLAGIDRRRIIPTAPLPRLMVNGQEAAAVLGINVHAFRRWVRDGVIVPILIAGKGAKPTRKYSLDALRGVVVRMQSIAEQEFEQRKRNHGNNGANGSA